MAIKKKQRKRSAIQRGIVEMGISVESVLKIETLISTGCEFDLHYGDHASYCRIKKPCWSVDFTRKLKKPRIKGHGLWDNHECGYSRDVNVAITKAYNNIKTGKRV